MSSEVSMAPPPAPVRLSLVRSEDALGAHSDGKEDGTARRSRPQTGSFERGRPPSWLEPEAIERSDEELTVEALTLDELYVRFAPYVARIATKILGREGEVQDVVQDVFAAAVSGLRRRTEIHQVKGWLAKVAVRTSMRKLRARGLWRFFDLDETPHYEALADPASGPFEAKLIAEVYEVLDEVSPADRVAWVLRYVEGESLESAAELCGCSLATVKRRIKRAHDKLERRFTTSAHGRLVKFRAIAPGGRDAT